MHTVLLLAHPRHSRVWRIQVQVREENALLQYELQQGQDKICELEGRLAAGEGRTTPQVTAVLCCDGGVTLNEAANEAAGICLFPPSDSGGDKEDDDDDLLSTWLSPSSEQISL